jgi:hypothetical protein
MPSNTYGRQVVEALTNKSGSSVAAGDVVIIDTTNNDAFTTNTASGFTGMIGIAQETIANNGTGRVLTAGYAALVNVNASVTRGNYGKTHTVAKQATDAGASRAAGAFCQFLTGGTTPDAHVFGLADASTSSSGVPAGTSFPGSPATNDLYYRTDKALLCYYDGTRWLTTTLYRDVFHYAGSAMPLTTSGTMGRMPPWAATYDLWLDAFYTSTYVATTNNGSNYYTVALIKKDNADAGTNIVTFNTSADTVNNWTQRRTAIGAAYVSASYREFDVTATVSAGAPGSLFWAISMAYRLIVT